MRALCRAKSAVFFAECLRDPATIVAEILSRETLSMLQRYAIFDRWSAALERACEEVEANLEDWRQNHQYLHYVAAERACPAIRSRALAAFRVVHRWRRGRPAAAARIAHARRRRARAGGRVCGRRDCFGCTPRRQLRPRGASTRARRRDTAVRVARRRCRHARGSTGRTLAGAGRWRG